MSFFDSSLYLPLFQLDIERVAQQAGFASSRQLRRVWKKFDVMPPSAHRLAERARA